MSKKLISIIIFSIITVLVWIGMEVFFATSGDDVEQDYSSYLTTLQEGFNEDALESLKEKEEEFIMVKPGELE
jgi:hypothetical protein